MMALFYFYTFVQIHDNKHLLQWLKICFFIIFNPSRCNCYTFCPEVFWLWSHFSIKNSEEAAVVWSENFINSFESEYRRIFFRSNIYVKQILQFLVTFPDYFRDYRTISKTFFGNSPERWPKIGVSASWKCCFWKKVSCKKHSGMPVTQPIS